MKLPNAAQALVPRAKIVDYLLSPTHADGSSKAAFFVHFGFDAAHWTTMAKALVEHAGVNDIARVETSPFGTRYVIEGIINAPDGRQPFIRTIWFIAENENTPRFVTAYPLKERTK